jgi:hypothetical protein
VQFPQPGGELSGGKEGEDGEGGGGFIDDRDLERG